MSITLPKYQRQVGVSAETGAVKGDIGVAGAGGRAISDFGQVVGQIAGNVIEKKREKEDTLTLIRANDLLNTRYKAGVQQMKLLTNPNDIEEFRASWGEQTKAEVASLGGSKKVKDRLLAESDGALMKFNAEADFEGIRALTDAEDLEFVKIQQNALDGNGFTNPETGEVMNAEQSYSWATDQRVSNNKLDYERGAEAKRSFSQDLITRTIVSASDNNPEEAEELFKGAKLTGDNLVIASDAIRDAKDRQKKIISTEQRRNTDELNTALQGGTISRTELRKYGEKTTNIMGKDVPLIEPDVLRTYESVLDASIGADETRFYEAIPTLKTLINQTATEGRSDFGDKEPIKMYKHLNSLMRSGASKATGEKFLNIANGATQKYAEGRGWSKEVSDEMNYITDSLTTLYTEFPTRYKDADPIGTIVQKVESFIKFAEEHDGTPSASDIKEWEQSSGVQKIREDVALNVMIKRFRVGEQEYKGGGTIKTYLGDGQWREEEI